MLSRAMKQGMVYATCDGFPVEPLPDEDGTIHSYWQRTTDNKIVDTRAPEAPPEDKWAKCIKAKATAVSLAGRAGVKCKQYQNVGPTGELDYVDFRVGIVDPKDIVGKWDDYRVLHTNVIEERYRKRVIDWLHEERMWTTNDRYDLKDPTTYNTISAPSKNDVVRVTPSVTSRPARRDDADVAPDGQNWPGGSRTVDGMVVSLFIPWSEDVHDAVDSIVGHFLEQK